MRRRGERAEQGRQLDTRIWSFLRLELFRPRVNMSLEHSVQAAKTRRGGQRCEAFFVAESQEFGRLPPSP